MRSQLEPTLFLTILLRSSDEDDGFLSLGWHGDFDTFTLLREPGKEAGGVAERPAVEPGGQQNHIRSKIRNEESEKEESVTSTRSKVLHIEHKTKS